MCGLLNGDSGFAVGGCLGGRVSVLPDQTVGDVGLGWIVVSDETAGGEAVGNVGKLLAGMVGIGTEIDGASRRGVTRGSLAGELGLDGGERG